MTCFPYGGPPQRNSDDMSLPKAETRHADESRSVYESLMIDVRTFGVSYFKTNPDGSIERIDPMSILAEIEE